jgi:microcystin-dependent protein
MLEDVYVGEIRLFAGSFVPQQWVACDGAELAIAQHSALFAVIGNAYGGDGVTTFRLPDLRGRVPVAANAPELPIGAAGGSEQVALQPANFPAHEHTVNVSDSIASRNTPEGNLLGEGGINMYRAVSADPPPATLRAGAVGAARYEGGAQPAGTPHDNVQPFLCVNYIMATQGIYPSAGEEHDG